MVLAFLCNNQARIVDMLYERIYQTTQAEAHFVPNELRLQSMTSGLLVVDKDTHRILKINRALERLSGLPATALVGKTVEEVFAGWSGLPLSEFAEEVERQGRITLRKHRLRTVSGREHYRSIHGEVFYNQRGENRGILVLVDDGSETEILRDTLSRFLSQHVMEQILSDADLRSLRSARRDVTVLFADIRDFTTFAEQHPPEQVVDVLNAYFDVMVHVLFEYQGTLDKFLGDGVLALFGTPLVQLDHAQRAVQVALAMQRAATSLNATRQRRSQPTLHMGIGINSGEAIVGNIGSEKRMEYTVIGEWRFLGLKPLLPSGRGLAAAGLSGGDTASGVACMLVARSGPAEFPRGASQSH